MNTPTKATGAAAMIATALVMTLVWGLDLYGGIKIPEDLSSAWQGVLTFAFGYLIHENTPK